MKNDIGHEMARRADAFQRVEENITAALSGISCSALTAYEIGKCTANLKAAYCDAAADPLLMDTMVPAAICSLQHHLFDAGIENIARWLDGFPDNVVNPLS